MAACEAADNQFTSHVARKLQSVIGEGCPVQGECHVFARALLGTEPSDAPPLRQPIISMLDTSRHPTSSTILLLVLGLTVHCCLPAGRVAPCTGWRSAWRRRLPDWSV